MIVKLRRIVHTKKILTILKTATDIGVKINVLLILSNGTQIGAVPTLILRNLTKIEKYNLY